ncbi:hypothetical protein AM437_00795 [Escherichia coli]|nr:hypothetical protein AM437_00795 [Escherichia coli]
MNAAKLNLHSDVTFICFSEACPQIELLSCGRTVLPRLLLSFQKPVCCHASPGNDSNLLIVFYVQIMPDDFVMQLHRF